jgi:DNA-binding NarL/FixJ family response regulator
LVASGRRKRPTSRQIEIAQPVADNLTDKVIAAQLDLTPSTVKNYQHAIQMRLRVTMRDDIAAWIVKRSE